MILADERRTPLGERPSSGGGGRLSWSCWERSGLCAVRLPGPAGGVRAPAGPWSAPWPPASGRGPRVLPGDLVQQAEPVRGGLSERLPSGHEPGLNLGLLGLRPSSLAILVRGPLGWSVEPLTVPGPLAPGGSGLGPAPATSQPGGREAGGLARPPSGQRGGHRSASGSKPSSGEKGHRLCLTPDTCLLLCHLAVVSPTPLSSCAGWSGSQLCRETPSK